MPESPVVIKLTPEQRAQIERASGKKVTKLAIEETDTGAGWLFTGGGKQSWLLKESDPEAYAAARQNHPARIDSRHTRFQLRIRESRIHNIGVFADERIPARRNVIEYVGEFINPVEAYRRNRGASKTYTFALDKFWRIDATVGGSGAEFINHSCDPNLRWRRSKDRVLCQSARPIQPGEELTLDYGFHPEAPKVACLCGSPKCRGTINRSNKRTPAPRPRRHSKKLRTR